MLATRCEHQAVGGELPTLDLLLGARPRGVGKVGALPRAEGAGQRTSVTSENCGDSTKGASPLSRPSAKLRGWGVRHSTGGAGLTWKVKARVR